MNTTDLQLIPTEAQPNLRRIVSLEDLWSVFVRLKGDLMPSTLGDYGSIGRRFCKFMEGRPLTAQWMLNWTFYLQSIRWQVRSGERQLNPRNINSINTRIRGFLRWLRIMGYLDTYLEEAIPTLATQALPEPKMFTEDDYNKVKAYCAERLWCQVHLWLVILGYRTGMSLVDCCFLRWRDVHLNDNSPSFIDIYRIKTRRLGGKALCKIPIIPFTDVHLWLMRLKKQEHANYKRHDGITDFVHQDAPGYYQCTFHALRQDFKNIFKYARITPGIRFKNLRNSFCSNLVNSNTNIALVCEMTGHNNVSMLLRYLKADRVALQDALARSFRVAAESAVEGVPEWEDVLEEKQVYV